MKEIFSIVNMFDLHRDTFQTSDQFFSAGLAIATIFYHPDKFKRYARDVFSDPDEIDPEAVLHEIMNMLINDHPLGYENNRNLEFVKLIVACAILDVSKNQAQVSSIENKGGIDLNPALMSMQVKNVAQDFKFDFNGAEIDAAQVTGATFTIRTMTPVTDLPQELELNK